MTKEEKTKVVKEKGKGLLADFKKFISRGNVVDLAVGVVIGTAFSAIVTALVNILLNLCLWRVPGGLSSLVTVLPALNNSAQAGVAGVQKFNASDISSMVETYAGTLGKTVDDTNYASFQTALLSLYTKHGNYYIYNGASIIDWGAFINAVISFIIIALVLFIVVKVFAYMKKMQDEADKKIKEAYYHKHPEARPIPVEPGKPEPTELDVLSEIRDLLKKQNDDNR